MLNRELAIREMTHRREQFVDKSGRCKVNVDMDYCYGHVDDVLRWSSKRSYLIWLIHSGGSIYDTQRPSTRPFVSDVFP